MPSVKTSKTKFTTKQIDIDAIGSAFGLRAPMSPSKLAGSIGMAWWTPPRRSIRAVAAIRRRKAHIDPDTIH
jgi:hypothetical protein